MPGYATAQYHAALHSLRTGIEPGETDPGTRTFSVASQTFDVPVEADSLLLSLWYYAVSSGGAGDTDSDSIMLVVEETAEVYDLVRLQYPQNNQQTWVHAQWNAGFLARFKGQRITLYVQTYNNGTDGSAALYIDDVSLWACQP